MSLIKRIEIANFRSIARLEWNPSPGINCIVAPGDSGKSSLLDAIDYCLGARRVLQVTDADFCNIDVSKPLRIAITLGALDDTLKNLETYGQYLRGMDRKTGTVVDEPEATHETVLTVELIVQGDLDPVWSLVSPRAAAQGLSRNLNWSDRLRLSPTRLGSYADGNLSWRRGSILNRISDERADTSAALAEAARQARASFGENAKDQLKETLKTVLETAKYLGIPVGDEIKAMLDAHSVSFSGGTISLHDAEGIPLRSLGLGSIRLLVAGLQRCAADKASLLLVDEVEHGLEPHRILRFLDTLGAKEDAPLQVFMTTHSPVVIRELSGEQLFVMRQIEGSHVVRLVGTDDDIQGTIRLFPEALLAQSALVCEGASEVGLARGLDQHQVAQGRQSMTACGVGTVDGGGSNTFKRARALQQLGYRVAVWRDSDVALGADATSAEKAFLQQGGKVFRWREGEALEDELFLSLSDRAVDALLAQAIELKESELIDAHVRSASGGARTLERIQVDALADKYSDDDRRILAKAAKSGKGWFKNISAMESIGRDVVGPDLEKAESDFASAVAEVLAWIRPE
jgi:hypothetical protein